MSPAKAVWRVGRPRSRAGRPAARTEQTSTTSRLVEGIEKRIRELAAEDFPEMWDALTEYGQDEFVRELAVAFASAPPEDRAIAMEDVIEGWRRTWLVRQEPGFDEAMKSAGKTPAQLGERVYTIDDLDEFLTP